MPEFLRQKMRPEDLIWYSLIVIVLIAMVVDFRSRKIPNWLTVPAFVAGLTLRTVLLWHGGAVSLWFLLPKRLSYFIWYLGPTMSDQQREAVGFIHGLPHYLQALQDDYLPFAGGLHFFAATLALGFLFYRRMKP